MERQKEVVCNLSNGAVSSDQISRSCHYLSLAQTIRDS